jgi:Restriction endonuclease
MDMADDYVRALYDSLTPKEFEKLLYTLLREMHFDNVQLVGKSGDGGIDLKAVYSPEIPGLQVGLDFVIQAKRFGPDTTINPIYLRALMGKVKGGQWGMLVTTGKVSQKTREEGLENKDRVVAVIDGKALVDLCQRYSVGFKTEYKFDKSFLTPETESEAPPEPEIAHDAPDDLSELLARSLGLEYQRVGRTTLYKNVTSGRPIVARWSQKYKRKSQNYWYGIRPGDISSVEENGVTDFAYVLDNEGVVLLPSHFMLSKIRNGDFGRSDSKTGALRHFHISFVGREGHYEMVMKEGRRENVEQMFHPLHQ